MWRRALIVSAALLLITPSYADTLLLEIWLNGRNTGVVAQVHEKDGRISVRNSDLVAAGIGMEQTGMTTLDAKTPIRAEEDATDQRLLLTVPPVRLSAHNIDLRPSIVEDVTPAGRGAILAYNVSATANDLSRLRQSSSAGGTLSLTLFAGTARFVTTGFAETGSHSQGSRLDTALEFDDPSAPSRLVVGDAVSGTPSWARAVRFGGIQFASDFSQQPDRVTFPLPDFFGLAAVPSTVDVFIDSARIAQLPIDDGPFQLHNLPILTGGDSATVVVHDILGHEVSQTVSLYTDPSLLAEGLSEYSFDGGFLRRQYGIAQADYAVPFASATWRHGFHDVTGEVHGEFAQHLQMAGGGIGLNVGDFGLLLADAAVSNRDGKTGFLGSANFNARFGALAFYSSVARAGGDFADVASLDGDPYPGLRYQIGASYSAGRYGAVTAGWIGERFPGQPATSLLTASYSLSFSDGIYFGLTGLRDLTRRSTAAEVFLSVPLGSAIATGSASLDRGKPSYLASYVVPVDPDGGFGYGITTQTSLRNMEADAQWIGDHGELDGAMAITDGKAALRLTAAGGVVALDGSVFATRQPYGAVALVDAGAPNVHVLRENRQIAISGSDGKVLLTDLNPYTENQISVDPRDYPMDEVVSTSERVVVPPRGSGVVVDLRPEGAHSFLAVVRLESGEPPPVGAMVKVETQSVPLIVGRNGEVFMFGLTRPVKAEIALGSAHCRVEIIPPVGHAKGVPRVGPFLCKVSDA